MTHVLYVGDIFPGLLRQPVSEIVSFMLPVAVSCIVFDTSITKELCTGYRNILAQGWVLFVSTVE